jgi:hypothetical protein
MICIYAETYFTADISATAVVAYASLPKASSKTVRSATRR